MSCNCVAKINDLLKPHNTTLLVGYSMAGSVNSFYVETAKIDEKKRGKPMRMVATFCPFCGVQLRKSEEEG